MRNWGSNYATKVAVIRRWGFRLSLALSLALCVATVALWAWTSEFSQERKYFSVDRKRLRCVELNVLIASGQCQISRNILNVQGKGDLDNWLNYMQHNQPESEFDHGLEYTRVNEPDDGTWSRSLRMSSSDRFHWNSSSGPSRTVTYQIRRMSPGILSTNFYEVTASEGSFELAFPLWVATLPFLLLSFTATWRAARRVLRKARRNVCLSCGYNLTGNTSGVCPECGTPLPNGSEIAA